MIQKRFKPHTSGLPSPFAGDRVSCRAQHALALGIVEVGPPHRCRLGRCERTPGAASSTSHRIPCTAKCVEAFFRPPKSLAHTPEVLSLSKPVTEGDLAFAATMRRRLRRGRSSDLRGVSSPGPSHRHALMSDGGWGPHAHHGAVTHRVPRRRRYLSTALRPLSLSGLRSQDALQQRLHWIRSR